MSTVCLGLPYLFVRRANHLRITDEESMARSAGPMLAIGACSCLVVRSRIFVTDLPPIHVHSGGDST